MFVKRVNAVTELNTRVRNKQPNKLLARVKYAVPLENLTFSVVWLVASSVFDHIPCYFRNCTPAAFGEALSEHLG